MSKTWRRSLIYLSLAVYLLSSFILEFSHNHTLELVASSDSYNEHLNDEQPLARSKQPCTACRLSRDRISIGPQIQFLSDTAISSSNVIQIHSSHLPAALNFNFGSRAHPA
jgi:hypothetical protein